MLSTKIQTIISRGIKRLGLWKANNSLIPNIYFGRHIAGVPDNSIVFFPCSENILFCGFAGIISFKNSKQMGGCVDIALLEDMVKRVESCSYDNCIKN